ncbi:hypothetical protein D3C77_468410 [compost metagenome]
MLALVGLAGCAQMNVQQYGVIESNQKSITVAPGSSGLLGMLKNELRQSGWKMSVYRGPSVSEGSETRTEHFDTFNTRYTLNVRFNQYDTCVIDFKGYSSFDISMIDNNTGSEVFTLDGSGCDSETVKKFRSML